jgi:eukaryotic-like serine/threonine-protein kinase
MTDDISRRDDAPESRTLEGRALALLRELLDVDADARDACLRQRTDDAALIARVRQLLAQVDESELDAPAPLDLRFGPYRARERIGQGGMGEVFRAERDDGSFQRHVAIKRMHGGYAGLAARFLRERQLLARLQHPNIAQLIDGGFDAHGQPWLAMELVDGEPIHRWCDARQAPLETRVRLMIQLCRALEHAHRNLIVHRDLKPGNVLVDAGGNAKLLDFGIARLLDDDGADPTQTQTMTPAWSTPEQRGGEPPTTTGDLYQLGLLLRLLLSGLPPQPKPRRMSREFADLHAKDRGSAIATARGAGTPDALARRLRGDLDAIVALATAEDPAHRYPTASAFSEDLERWLDGQPVRARAEERGYRLRRAARRYWPAVAAGVAALAFLGYHLVSINTALQRVEAERAAAIAAKNRENRQRVEAEQQRDRANAIADYFTRLFEEAAPSDIARDRISARQLLEGGYRRLGRDTGMPDAVRTHLLVATANAFGAISQPDERVRILRDTATEQEQRRTTDPDALADTYRELSLALNAVGDYDGADDVIRKGLALYADRKASDPDSRHGLLQAQAMLLLRKGDRDAARATFTAIIDDTASSLHRQSSVESRISAFANRAQTTSDAASAEADYRRALALIESRDPGNLDLKLVVMNYLASVLSRQRKDAEAAALAERTLDEARRHYVGHEAWLGIITLTAGKIDLVQGRHARGAERTATAYRIIEAALGPGNPIVVHTAEDALLGALIVDDVASAERLRAVIAATPKAERTPQNRRIADAYLPCMRAPTPVRIAALQAAVRTIPQTDPKRPPLIAEIDWVARCEQRMARR